MIGWSEDGEGVGVVLLSRPPVNAFDQAAKRELEALLRSLERRADIRCLVVRSALDGVFCAGSDLHELAREHARPGAATERTHFELGMWERLSHLPQVSIAAIEGHALGSGLELAIACDFRIVGAAARMGLPEIRIGGAPGTQALVRLPAIVGLGVARRMLLTGESLSAEEARSVGLVDAVTPAGEAVEAAMRLAAELALRPASSMAFLKDVLEIVADGMLERVGQRVDAGVEALFGAPEMREGIAAFLEKRAPDFRSVVPGGRERAT